MKQYHWFRQKRLSFKIGLILCLLHFVFSIFIACNIIIWSQNAQWQFLWFLPFVIDLPFSLVYKLVFYLPLPKYSFSFLPYPMSEFRDFILPFFLHSIFGTLWYFYLPLLIAKIIAKGRKNFT